MEAVGLEAHGVRKSKGGRREQVVRGAKEEAKARGRAGRLRQADPESGTGGVPGSS